MAGLDDLLGSALGGNALTAIASQLGIPEAGAKQALGAALPSLLGQLKANADDPAKSAALHQAIDNDHDGAVLDDVHGLLGDANTEATGTKILGHVFGDNAGDAAQAVALKGGIAPAQATKLLALLAPLVLGALGRAKKQGGGAGGAGGGLSDLLGGVLGGGGALGGLLGSVLGGGGGALGGLGSVLGGADSGSGGAGGIGGVLSDVLGGGSGGSGSAQAPSGASSRTGKGGVLGKILGGLLKRK